MLRSIGRTAAILDGGLARYPGELDTKGPERPKATSQPRPGLRLCLRICRRRLLISTRSWTRGIVTASRDAKFEWLSGDMSDKKLPQASDLPADTHLPGDVAPASEEEHEEAGQSDFTPGQTNAGQQVGGLASATGYGKEQDPDSGGDLNNPV
jgi:hypothetical protein